MSPTSWKQCRQCFRKQSRRHIGDYCGPCESDQRRKAKKAKKQAQK